jgi:hypothetical protein
MHPSPKAKAAACLAIARVVITTNPNAFPKQSILTGLIPPLVWLIKNSEHEQPEFEAAMALTNLASVGPNVQNAMMHHHTWPALRTMISSENPMCQRASIECMLNLAMCEPALELLSSEAGEQDLRFFLIFAQQDDDIPVQSAATGALAMLSGIEEILTKVLKLEFTTLVPVDDFKAQLNLDENVEQMEVIRSGLTVLRYLKQRSAGSSPAVQTLEPLDEGVKTRVDYIWNNAQQLDLIPDDSHDLAQVFAPWVKLNPIKP